LKKDSIAAMTIIVSPAWKYSLVEQIHSALSQTRNPGEVLKLILATELKTHLAEITKTVPMLVKDPSKLPKNVLGQSVELRVVQGAAEYLHKTFACPITVLVAEESNLPKASAAFPGRPAIVLG
jgi:hypothetical protein